MSTKKCVWRLFSSICSFCLLRGDFIAFMVPRINCCPFGHHSGPIEAMDSPRRLFEDIFSFPLLRLSLLSLFSPPLLSLSLLSSSFCVSLFFSYFELGHNSMAESVIWGCLHVSDSGYELPYDSVYNLHRKVLRL
jgi:hypothetical protein